MQVWNRHAARDSAGELPKVQTAGTIVQIQRVMHVKSAWMAIRHTQSVRSNVRYWIASLTCSQVISSALARSATVRETFRIRS